MGNELFNWLWSMTAAQRKQTFRAIRIMRAAGCGTPYDCAVILYNARRDYSSFNHTAVAR